MFFRNFFIDNELYEIINNLPKNETSKSHTHTQHSDIIVISYRFIFVHFFHIISDDKLTEILIEFPKLLKESARATTKNTVNEVLEKLTSKTKFKREGSSLASTELNEFKYTFSNYSDEEMPSATFFIPKDFPTY